MWSIIFYLIIAPATLAFLMGLSAYALKRMTSDGHNQKDPPPAESASVNLSLTNAAPGEGDALQG